MNDEKMNELAKKLAFGVECQLDTFLKKDVLGQLNFVKNELVRIHEPFGDRVEPQHPLTKVFDQIIKDLIKEGEEKQSDAYWENLHELFWSRLDYYFQVSFYNYLRYSVIYVVLSNNLSSFLDRKYLTEVKEKCGIKTNKHLKELLSETFQNDFYDEIKQGGKKGFWKEHKKLKFLGMYNRFFFIIRDIRKFLKISKKEINKNVLETICDHYQIPENLRNDIGQRITNAELALSWAKREMQLDQNDEYLKDILEDARKIWIKKNQVKEEEKKQFKNLILFEVNNDLDDAWRFYSIHKDDNEGVKSLRYGSMARKFKNKAEFYSVSREQRYEKYLHKVIHVFNE